MKRPHVPKEKLLNWGLGIFLVLALIRFVSTPADSTNGKETEMDFSTSIPTGYVLVPIELENSLALEGVLGDVGGHVDLYESTARGQGRKLAHNVKLVRAPKDPRQFAVLAKEALAPALVRHDGPLVATMRNPQDRTRNPEVQRSRSTFRILYGGEHK